jgi:hypothetical protein
MEIYEKYLMSEAKQGETVKLPLTGAEKKLIGKLKVYKEKYKLDRTQSNYRYDNNTFSQAFTGKQDLDKLKELVKEVK